jgi:hypothetical protein
MMTLLGSRRSGVRLMYHAQPVTRNRLQPLLSPRARGTKTGSDYGSFWLAVAASIEISSLSLVPMYVLRVR